MTVGELIDKLGEVPADTPVVMHDDVDSAPEYELFACDYDEERGVVRLS